jgi:hypothetical protein
MGSLTVTVVMLSCHRQDQRPHCPVQIQYRRGAPHSSDQRMLQKYLLSFTPPSHPLHTPCFARALLAAAAEGSSTVLPLLTIMCTGNGCLQASVANEGSGYLPVMSSLM